MSEPSFFYTDEDGNKCDGAMHEEMLNNPEAEALSAQAAIERQLAKGMNLAMAVSLYGTPAMQQAVAEGKPPF